MERRAPKPVHLSVAWDMALGAFLTFNASEDDWANYDPVTMNYRESGVWQDSFLRLSGYRTRTLPFEFVRRLAWRLGNIDGYFKGLVFLLKGAKPTVPGYYDDEEKTTSVPPVKRSVCQWQTVAGGTVYFPVAIEDFEPIVNVECNDAFIYLGRSDDDGSISRLDEDDEWLIRGNPSEFLPAVEHLASEFQLPVISEELNVAAAKAEIRRVPKIGIIGGQVLVAPRD
jgi:hypothetical protein